MLGNSGAHLPILWLTLPGARPDLLDLLRLVFFFWTPKFPLPQKTAQRDGRAYESRFPSSRSSLSDNSENFSEASLFPGDAALFPSLFSLAAVY